jgi:hypothetical protein
MRSSAWQALAYLFLFALGVFLFSYVKQIRYKKCPECEVRVRLGAPRCPFCGHVFNDESDSKWSKPFYEP